MSWKHVYHPSKKLDLSTRESANTSAISRQWQRSQRFTLRVKPASKTLRESTTNSFVSPQNPNDICRQFDSLRDRLGKVSIPENFKVNDSPMGIKQESKPCLKVISKTARHAETGLKVLANITSPDNETSDGSYYLTATQAQDLFTVFASQATFLQSEYATLVVRSTFNAETSRIFKQFENNSSAFTESSLRNVRIAAELSSISDRQQSHRGTGSFNRNHRGSRFIRGRNRGFSHYRGNGVNFNDIPQRPPTDDGSWFTHTFFPRVVAMTVCTSVT